VKAPPRPLKHAEPQLFAQLPATPSAYLRQVVLKAGHALKQPMGDEVKAFRELNGRLPNGRDFATIQLATGLFGGPATVQALQRSGGDTAGLLALLDEQHEAMQANDRKLGAEDIALKDVIAQYQAALGGVVGAALADEMRHMLREQPDLAIWSAAFRKGAADGKRSWAYVRAILRNPSPGLLAPEPVNDAAKFAHEQWRKRIGRGTIDVFVAGRLNELAEKVTDITKWQLAFDEAAAQNALNLNYLSAVLTGAGKAADGKGSKATARRRGAQAQGQREQVHYTSEELAAKEQALDIDARLAELEARRKRRSGT
jgi:hypothetical protein